MYLLASRTDLGQLGLMEGARGFTEYRAVAFICLQNYLNLYEQCKAFYVRPVSEAIALYVSVHVTVKCRSVTGAFRYCRSHRSQPSGASVFQRPTQNTLTLICTTVRRRSPVTVVDVTGCLCMSFCSRSKGKLRWSV